MRQQQILTTRRQALVGTASFVIIGALVAPASAAAPGAWFAQVAAGIASGYLVEALKNWGLVPQAKAPTTSAVTNHHHENIAEVRQRGYEVRPVYSGDSAAGSFALSEARQRDDFLALATTNHGSTCTVRLDKADAMNLGLVSGALRQKGFSPQAVAAAGHPIHPAEGYQFVDGERYSPTYMTPAHGTIAWKTDLNNPRPNAITALRSGIVDCNIHVAQLDSGRWTFDMRPPTPLSRA